MTCSDVSHEYTKTNVSILKRCTVFNLLKIEV